jgi:hypothetical protein
MALSASCSRRIAGYDGVARSQRYSLSQERTRSSSDLSDTAGGWLVVPDTSTRE